VTKLASLIPALGKSKYETAIIAAREARRLNDWSRQSGQPVPGKVTSVALERAVRGEVAFAYEDGSTSI
jgi:DNA-directed RNA polymerase subunit K/omega